MSVKSNPGTCVHAAGSKISETCAAAGGVGVFAIFPSWPLRYRLTMPHAQINGQEIYFEDTGGGKRGLSDEQGQEAFWFQRGHPTFEHGAFA